jgi:hypothetical protein
MKYYKAMLWKEYFDKGYGVTSYVKWIIALTGLTTRSFALTMALFALYGLLCFGIGKLWYKYGLVNAEHEVQNVVNPFVKEVREKLK